MVALPEEDELRRNTDALIARRPDIFVTTIDIGFWCTDGGWRRAVSSTS